jgi:hypothetical protein
VGKKKAHKQSGPGTLYLGTFYGTSNFFPPQRAARTRVAPENAGTLRRGSDTPHFSPRLIPLYAEIPHGRVDRAIHPHGHLREAESLPHFPGV